MTEQHAPAVPTVRVWDLMVRAARWLLVISVLFAWLTRHGGGAWHEYLGYASLVVVGVRILWGWRGSEHARFAAFLHGPRQTLSYALQVLCASIPVVVQRAASAGLCLAAAISRALACRDLDILCRRPRDLL